MKLTISRSKNSVSFYVSESFRDKFGHSTSRTVMKLGTKKSIKEKYGEDFDVEAWAKAYVQKLNDDAATKKPVPIVLELPADTYYDKGETRLFNVGYLALQKILYSIGLKEIVKSINKRTKIEFDLERILADLIYSRILEPNSKLSFYEYCKEHLLELPEYDLHQIYRALDVIAEEADFIQSSIYKNSNNVASRNTSILFYDCTNFNKIFYKEKYLVDEKSKLEQRIIVTYSIKYKYFMEKKRIRDIERAKKLITSNNSKKIEIKGQNDVRKYIQSKHTTKLGEKAENTSYALNEEEIQKQAKYDGFYAVCTSIDKTEMSVEEIIRVNKGRWEMEESFMLMKTEFKSRPVYVYNEERIKAHFVTCFMALLVYRILEQKILAEAKEPVTAPELIKTLREMQITNIGKYYTGSFKRTDLTDLIQAFGDFKFDCNLITPSKIKGYIKNSKKV